MCDHLLAQSHRVSCVSTLLLAALDCFRDSHGISLCCPANLCYREETHIHFVPAPVLSSSSKPLNNFPSLGHSVTIQRTLLGYPLLDYSACDQLVRHNPQ